MQTPPSPALSLCDTLSDSDLDAYLDGLPSLSSLPSPTMKEAWWREESMHGRHDSFLSDIPSSDVANAEVLCNITKCDSCSAVKQLPAMITQFLSNSRMPVETVALAYNILSHPAVASMHCWHGDSVFDPEQMQKMVQIHGPESDASCQRALVILSALNIAVCFTEDQSRSLFHWSRQVAEGTFSTEQIGSMKRLVLSRLEWQIHSLNAPAAVAAAVKALSNCETPPDNKFSVLSPTILDNELRLLIGPETILQHGLATPQRTPPDCMFGDDERTPYLLQVSPA